MNKAAHSYLPPVIRVLKCTADRRRNFTLNSNVGERRQEEYMKAICVRFINYELAVCGCYCF